MKHKSIAVRVLILDLLVEANGLPMLNAVWLTLSQIGPHGKGSLGQFERVFVVLGHSLDKECADIAHGHDRVKGGESRISQSAIELNSAHSASL